MTLRTDAVRELSAWAAPTPDQVALRGAYLDYLAEHDDAHVAHAACPATSPPAPWSWTATPTRCCSRCTPRSVAGCRPAGTASPATASLADAALREATEESRHRRARAARRPDPPRPPRGALPSRTATRSTSTCSTSRSPPTAHAERISEESTDLRWWPVDALPGRASTGQSRALVSRAVALVG